ncbi:hypothetical protein MicB006_3628 [Micromonospora sp. B006]|nr:hypothetical protein MicB006_3628 [Micromonospora sp. B006]
MVRNGPHRGRSLPRSLGYPGIRNTCLALRDQRRQRRSEGCECKICEGCCQVVASRVRQIWRAM